MICYREWNTKITTNTKKKVVTDMGEREYFKKRPEPLLFYLLAVWIGFWIVKMCNSALGLQMHLRLNYLSIWLLQKKGHVFLLMKSYPRTLNISRSK